MSWIFAVLGGGPSPTMDTVTRSAAELARLVAVDDTTSPDPSCLVPGRMTVDDTDTPCDMVDALALAAFVAGSQPFAKTVRLDAVRAGATLLPPEATAWLGRPNGVNASATLAELYALRNNNGPARSSAPPSGTGTGLYL